ncbi:MULTISPECIES: hypothetical protein [Enterobacter cloacae complex]|uniref:hypothetical protein n=1 Tax=Enterobacter cloacae complex TaxID=354276 RepID=UPI000D3E5C12|nr:MULTISPECIES: hypothetical protein [Enterobacter cloacae complex]AWC85802.1 hypothetical protein AM410_15760 [Enterobacter cloacae complex sp. FDA-CDC-AR_0164]MED5697620.1 hypothetical protein [Enterobacter ludwigii]
MGFQYWLAVCGIFLTGPFAFVQSIIFLRRGVYTKTFKGTTRKEYIHKDSKPIEYWFSVIAQMIIGVVMIGFGFWLLDDLPAFHNWHTEIREMLPF